MTVREHLTAAAAVLKEAGMDTCRLDAEVLLAHVLRVERQELLLRPHLELAEEAAERFRQAVARRCGHEPVAYIVGEKEFWSLSLLVNRHVLIPRPDTENLVEEALRFISSHGLPPFRILEIGTGSGAVSVALAAAREDIRVTATDISADALEVAMANAARCGVAGRIDFICCSLFDGLSGTFDMIVSNPPYITDDEFAELPEDVRGYEPPAALRGGPDGLGFHREIIAGAVGRLRPGGLLAMEMGAGQRPALEETLRAAAAYDRVQCRRDYAGMDRVILARRI